MLEDLSDHAITGPEKNREEAAMWLARLARGIHPDEVPTLRVWLTDRLNRRIVLDMARLWHGPDILALLSELIPAGPEPMERTSWRSYLATAAQLTIATLLVAWAFSGWQPQFRMQRWTHVQGSHVMRRAVMAHDKYFTDVGERGDVQLADGSHVTLNTNTRMTVAFMQSVRQVNMPYGEATFQVAADPKRPFVVQAGNRRFEALGTNFNVRVLTPDNVKLTVTEGNVKVFYTRIPDEDIPAIARLHANMVNDDTTVGALHTALVEPGLQFVRKIGAADADSLLAWQQGLLRFNGDSLEDVLAEMDRYTHTQFVLGDERLRNVRIGGSFRTGDVAGLLRSLRKDFRIDWRPDGPGRVVLMASTSTGLPQS
jgi:transmembrane sensor